MMGLLQAQRWLMLSVLCIVVGTSVAQIDDPELFLIADEYDSSVTSGATQHPRRLVPASARAQSASAAASSAAAVELGVDDPELILALQSKEDAKPLGESSATSSGLVAPRSVPGKVTYDRAASRILGSFVIETIPGSNLARGHSELGEGVQSQSTKSSETPRQIGSKGQVSDLEEEPHPQAGVKEINTDAQKEMIAKRNSTTGHVSQTDFAKHIQNLASAIIEKEQLAPKLHRLATQYLAEKQQAHKQLKSETVRQLSQMLLKSKTVNTELLRMQTMSHSQLATPEIGKSYQFPMGVNSTDTTRIVLKVDGVEFTDGEQFIAPEGHIVDVKRCKRYLDNHNVEAMVQKAKTNVSRTHDEFIILNAKSKKLMHEAKLQQAENPKLRESVQDKLFMKQATDALAASRAAKSNFTLAQATLEQLQTRQEENKAKEIRNDNVDAREAQVAGREKAVAEREDVYKQAAVQLKNAAKQLKRAGESQTILSFPEKEAKLQEQLNELKISSQSVKEREQVVKNKEERLAARMRAFGSAVEVIVQKSTDASGGVADDWADRQMKDTTQDVGDFTASLQAIRRKFNSKNPREAAAAKDGIQIIQAVRTVVETHAKAVENEQDTGGIVKKHNFRIQEKQSALEQAHVHAGHAAKNISNQSSF